MIKFAIQKAIEGGYKRGLIGFAKIKEVNCDWVIVEDDRNKKNTYDAPKLSHYSIGWIFLDPLFWKSLGKSLGWIDTGWEEVTGWQHYWHRFIDHLIAKKSPESFFEELLK